MKKADELFADLYPELPDRKNGGARDDQSTRLHLSVIMMTYQIMSDLIGEDTALNILKNNRIYGWVNSQVVNPVERENIKGVMEKAGIPIQP